MATLWEYCILTRLSAGLDTKWHVNRVFQHHDNELPEEVTESVFRDYNTEFDRYHDSRRFPTLPAILNRLGADGWELIDDMDTGLNGEGLVFKREAVPAKKAARPAARRGVKKAAPRKRGR